MKAFPAIFFAVLIAAVLGGGMLAIGANAVLNPGSRAVANSPQAANPPAGQVSASDTSQLQQYQQLISQYQAREQQYQSELKDAAQRLSTANQQVTQANQQLDAANNQVTQAAQQLQFYQTLFNELQRRGIISVNNNGQVVIGRGGFSGDSNN
jgi:outer membrane protein TolC